MILLLGGTTEARLLLEKLIEERIPVIFSTAYEFAGGFIAKNPLVRHIAGKLDVDELAALILREEVGVVIDATHPYATDITRNARVASDISGVVYIRVGRPIAESVKYENIKYVESMEEAVVIATRSGATIFLATGSNQAKLFAERVDMAANRVYIRVLPTDESVAKCREAGFTDERIITGIGPFSVEENEELWRCLGITVVVTKESGREGGFPEKVAAAQRLAIPLVVIARPRGAGEELLDWDEVIAAVRGVLETKGDRNGR